MFERWPRRILGALAAGLALAGGARGEEVSRNVRALSQAYNESGQELFGKLAAKPGNMVISPYSIGAVMAMAVEGASGANAEEMIRVLKHRLPQREIGEANKEALEIFRSLDRSAVAVSCPQGMQLSGARCQASPPPDGRCPPLAWRDGELCKAEPARAPSAQFRMANSLMITGFGKRAIIEDYVDRIRRQYAGEVFENASLADVNGWVSRKTAGKIPQILGQLDPNTAAVLLNAVHFKGAWAHPFNKQMTRDEPFRLSPKETVKTPMMKHFLRLPHMKAQGYQAIRLPFATAQLGLVVMLPDEQTDIEEAHRLLGSGGLALTLAKLREASSMVDLSLPRFQVRYEASLKPSFEAAGMKKAFQFGFGFSKMLSAEAMISRIEHRAAIEVNEEGCEASAAAAATFLVRAVPAEPPVTFKADRPFLFYLQDEATGAILFQGRMTNPRAAS